MTPRTTAVPVTELAMWRKLLARAHPDAGGDHEPFLWATALKEIVDEPDEADINARVDLLTSPTRLILTLESRWKLSRCYTNASTAWRRAWREGELMTEEDWSKG